MATEHWFRWHHGTVTDPKWRVVAARASSAMSRNVTVGHVVSVWAAMMECASQANPRGELIGWCDEDIAAAFGYAEDEVAAIRCAMQGKTLDGDTLEAWNRRQIKAEDVTAVNRKRRQRERESASSTNRDEHRKEELSQHVTAGHDRVEESRGEEEQSSLRSDSSSATPTTPPADLGKARSERLAQVTAEAIDSFNAALGKPVGLLPAINPAVGAEKRRAQVKRCLRVASQICVQQFGGPTVTRGFWEAYWAECAMDEFKSGRQTPGKGHENWTPSFEYLTREAVMLEVFDRATSAGATA